MLQYYHYSLPPDPEDTILILYQFLSVALYHFTSVANNESLEAYKRAISLRPDEGFYYYMASQIYTLLEESKEAIEMIDKAIVLSPSDITYQKMKEHILRAFGIEKDLVEMTLEQH